MVLSRCLDELEERGYQSKAFDIPSCGVGLPSVERHVWIVAARHGVGMEGNPDGNSVQWSRAHARDNRRTQEKPIRWDLLQPYTMRSRKGFPDYVDRITALGNAIVPQVAFQILRHIRALIP